MIDDGTERIIKAILSNMPEKKSLNYIDKNYVNDLFAEYFCGKDDCDGWCQNCYKNHFIEKMMNDKEHSC